MIVVVEEVERSVIFVDVVESKRRRPLGDHGSGCEEAEGGAREER